MKVIKVFVQKGGLILFLFQINQLLASFPQNKNTTDTLNELSIAKWQLQRARSLGGQNQDSSSIYFNKAKNTYLKYEKHKDYVMCFYFESYTFYLQKEYEKSIQNYKRTIEVANKFLTPLGDPLVLAIINSMGITYWLVKDYQGAKDLYLKGLKYQETFGDKPHFALLYSNLAKTYEILDDLNKSLDYWDKAFIILKRHNMRQNHFANYYDNVGDIFLQKKDYDKVIEFKLKALEIYQSINNTIGIVGCYDFLGRVHWKMKNYEKSHEWYFKGVELIKKNDPIDALDWRSELALIYIGIGNVYKDQQKLTKAHEYYLRAYQTTSDLDVSYGASNLGKSYLALANYDSALFYIQEGINKIHYSFQSSDIYENPKDLQRTSYKLNLLFLLENKAKGFYKKYISENKANINDLNMTFETIKLALKLIDIMFNELGTAGSKLDWTDDMLPIYEQAIETAMALYKATNDEKYNLIAFEIAEKSKAGVLYSDLKSSKAKSFAGLPDSLLNKEQDQKRALSHFTSELNKQYAKKEKQDTAKIIEFKEKIFALNRENEALESYFETNYPKYFQLKYNQDKIDMNEIEEEVLDSNTSLIEYVVGDRNIYVFVLSKDRFDVITLNTIDSLSNKIKNLKFFLNEDLIENYIELGHQLYKDLIAPLNLEKNQNLIIIPDGPLWQLNFDILLSGNEIQKQDYRFLPYLIYDFTINYTYSAKLLNDNFKRDKKPVKNEVIAFSYNNPNDASVGEVKSMRGFRNAELADLPGTRKEIKAVSSQVEGAYFFGSFANERNFKENAKNFQILHLALHGVIDDENPMNSKLYFTQDQDSVEDNYLHAYELYNIELNADLAVLSACNTGSGKLVKGEGIMSLGRAFTYAGCNSLLLSQWEVSDAFTPVMMKNFYQNLNEGKTKSAALRDAKLAFIAEADNLSANPFFWAPLVQLGDNSPLSKQGSMKWVIAVSVLLCVGVVVYFYLNKKKNLN